MSWVKDIFDPDERRWEEIYRNRFQNDKVVRSTHGVNCTGGCSWNIHVKNGVVALETQATDYPRISCDVPPYEPRGCQRGISSSWYLYSPLRVKYPYLRGVLMDLWREARKVHADPVAAWASIVDDPAKRRSYQEARGKGGLRRSSWDEVLELIAASTIHTIKQHGSDRIIGFSPIPAMSMLSFAAGSRFLQLLGGVNLSFYDWYCDLPNASPEVWGEQTDVAESADWYHSKFIVSMGANLGMTRTPDVHFAAEARHDGAKLVVLSPDFSMTSKYADQWIPIHAGQDAAFWLAVDHVILKEFHHEKQTPYFLDYVRRYSDAPFLVELEQHDGGLRPGRMLRASELARTRDAENGDFKFLVWDGTANAPRMPRGTLGFRWQHEKGQWNLEMKDGVDGQEIDARTSFLDGNDGVAQVAFDEYASGRVALRGVPVRTVETLRGPVAGRHRLRPALRPVRRLARPGRRVPGRLRRRRRRLHPGLAGALHRRLRGRGDPLRPRVGHDRGEDRRQVLGHHRRRREPVVPRQSRLPRRHRRPRPLRLRRQERRRPQPLRRPGEARAGGALVGARLRARLGRPAAAAERAQLPLRPLRPVALRAGQRGREAEPASRAERRSPPATPWTTRPGPCASAGCPSSPSSTARPPRWWTTRRRPARRPTPRSAPGWCAS